MANTEITRLFGLSGRTAVITGAGSGIGRATAMTLSGAGANVVLGDIDEKGMGETARMVEDTGGKALTVKTDVSKKASVEALVQQAVAQYGRVDIMANVAGIAHQALVVDITEEDMDRVFGINLKGVVFGCQAAMKPMMAQRSGAIVNISSSVIYSYAGDTYAVYAMAKAGVGMLTKVMAKEAAPYGIRVNAIAPAIIETPMTQHRLDDPELRATYLANLPLGRIGRPEDVANTALFLASNESDFMTGATLLLDGGWTLR